MKKRSWATVEDAREAILSGLKRGSIAPKFALRDDAPANAVLAVEQMVDDGTLVHVRSEKSGRVGYTLAEEKSDAAAD